MVPIYPKPKIAFICIPYMGGDRYAYNRFQSFLGRPIRFVPIELPGRGKRIAAPLLTDLDKMVEDLYEQMEIYWEGTYILYGHAMGGLLGNLLIQKLKAEDRKLPLFFLVSGSVAPSYVPDKKMIHQLKAPELVEELRLMGSFPEEILASEEWIEFLLPIIRADLKALETGNYANRLKHSVPTTAIAGTEETIEDRQLDAWAQETNGHFEAFRYSGQHFFILKHFDKMAQLVKEKLPSSLSY